MTRGTPWDGLGATSIIMNVATGKRPEFDEGEYTKLYGKDALMLKTYVGSKIQMIVLHF